MLAALSCGQNDIRAGLHPLTCGRLLDDNRELYVPELQETVRPHPHFMLFSTQNPAGAYGGRKARALAESIELGLSTLTSMLCMQPSGVDPRLSG